MLNVLLNWLPSGGRVLFSSRTVDLFAPLPLLLAFILCFAASFMASLWIYTKYIGQLFCTDDTVFKN